jgi:RHS repeat-associated protein
MDDTKRVALVETKTFVSGATVTDPPHLLRYQYGDHLGSASVETDGTGAIITYEEYFPFGGTSFHAETGGERFKRYRYNAKEKDEETGLYYYGARYYAAWLGRWTAADPAGFVDGPNLYAYVSNRPVVMVDPNGMEGDPPLALTPITPSDGKPQIDMSKVGTPTRRAVAPGPTLGPIGKPGADTAAPVETPGASRGEESSGQTSVAAPSSTGQTRATPSGGRAASPSAKTSMTSTTSVRQKPQMPDVTPDTDVGFVGETWAEKTRAKAVRGASNKALPRWERLIYFGLGMAATPLVKAIEITRGVVNAPNQAYNKARNTGEYAAQAFVHAERGETAEALDATAHAASSAIEYFENAGTVGGGLKAGVGLVGTTKNQLGRQIKEAERMLRTNKEFKSWFHTNYKRSEGIPIGRKTNSNLDPDLLVDAYEEWIGLGRPNRK